MKCPTKTKSAEADAKSFLHTNDVIDDNMNILNHKEFEAHNELITKKGIENYGIKADWFTIQNNKAIANKEAFEAVDFINQVKYNGKQVDVSSNDYLRQLNARNLQSHIIDQERLKENNEAVACYQQMIEGTYTFKDPTFITKDDKSEDEIPMGHMPRLIQQREVRLKNVNERILETERLIKINKDNPTHFKALTLDSNNLKKKKEELENDISAIKKIDTKAPALFEEYVRHDLDRLSDLVNSDDVRDNKEASDIIEMIQKIGDFSSANTLKLNGHPIYEHDEMFDKDDNFQLHDSIIEPLRNWADEAGKFKIQLEAKQLNNVVKRFNELSQVKEFYDNKKFTSQELLAARKDAHWIDMMLYDVKSGLFGNNGSFAQSLVIESNNVYRKYIADISNYATEEINRVLPHVTKKLNEMGYGFHSLGIGKVSLFHGVRWTLFRQQYKNGDKTRDLASKYSIEYKDAKNKMIAEFWKSFKGANSFSDATKVFIKRNAWIRQNTLFVNPALLEDLKNNSKFSNISHLFSNDNDTINKHTQDIKNLVGDIHFHKIIEEQKHKLQEYQAQLELKTDELLDNESKNDINDLSEKSKTELLIWKAQNSPFEAANYMNNGDSPIEIGNKKVHPVALNYNDIIPLKEINRKESDFYDKNYQKIEDEPILKEFYDVAHETLNRIFDVLDYSDQQKLNAETLPLREKQIIELLTNEGNSFYKNVIPAFVKLEDNLRSILGIKKQNPITSDMLDGLSEHPPDSINKSFISDNIDKINTIAKTRYSLFTSKYNIGRVVLSPKMTVEQMKNAKLNKVTKKTALILNNLNRDRILDLIRPYLRANDPYLFAANDTVIPIGKIIYNATQNEIVEENSFDLPKMLKVYAHLVANYAAQKEMLPYMQIAKKYYESIKKLQTTNTQEVKSHTSGKDYTKGLRVNANKQMDNWYQRVILNNMGLRNQYGVTDKKIYTVEERKQIKELDEAISLEKNKKIKEDLIAQKEALGSFLAGSGIVDAILAQTRFLSLAYNLSSGLNNFMGGQTDNEMNSHLYLSNPDYITTVTPLEMIYANLASMTGKSHMPEKIAKSMCLMEKYDLLKNASNVLQKPTMRGAFASMNRFSPYYELKKGEDYNQTPINMAILKDTEILDKNGNKSNIFDATRAEYNKTYDTWELKLKNEFDTKHNRENWLESNGEDYKKYKERAEAIITDIHGDYNPRGGMMAKSYQIGQATTMFKGWMPRQYLVRFAAAQDRIDLGKEYGKDWGGRYKSHTPLSFAIHGSMLGMFTGGPMGALAGFGIGLGLGLGVQHNTKSVHSLGILSELLNINKILARKLLGFAVNPLPRAFTGKTIIKTDYDKLYDKMKSPTFTRQDFRRYQSCMSDMAVTLVMIGGIMITKAALWDDRKKKKDMTDEDKRKRAMHNFFANKFISLSNEITSYLDIVEGGKNIGMPIMRTFNNIQTLIKDFDNFTQGWNIAGGSSNNAGQSILWNQTKKTLIPGLLAHPFTFGFQNAEQQQFQTTPFDKWFWSDEKKAKTHLKLEKAEEKDELDEQVENGELDEKQEKKILKHDFPVKKKHQTYKDLFKKHKERQEQESE